MAACDVDRRRWRPLRSRNPSDVISGTLDDVTLDDVTLDDVTQESDRRRKSRSAKSWLPREPVLPSSDPVPVPADFRLASWNILSDNCIRSGQYLYCPSEVRYMDSRHGRIVGELRSIDPDVVCLQEADEDNFRFRLKPDMEKLGYGGVNHPTGDGQGLATFWKLKEFQMIEEKSRILSDVIREHLDKNPNLDAETRLSVEKWSRRPEVTSVVLLRHLKTGNDVAVGNIHVGWMGLRRPTLQATQIALAFREAMDLVVGSSSDCSLVFCGDFNTPPSFPAYRLLTTGSIDNGAIDNFVDHHNDVIDEVDLKMFEVITKVIPEIFQLPVAIQSAYLSVTGHEPNVTNCDGAHDDSVVRSFCLDYIWYRKLDSIRVLETPELTLLTEDVALPNRQIPSDHVPIATDFAFQ